MHVAILKKNYFVNTLPESPVFVYDKYCRHFLKGSSGVSNPLQNLLLKSYAINEALHTHTHTCRTFPYWGKYEWLHTYENANSCKHSHWTHMHTAYTHIQTDTCMQTLLYYCMPDCVGKVMHNMTYSLTQVIHFINVI